MSIKYTTKQDRNGDTKRPFSKKKKKKIGIRDVQALLQFSSIWSRRTTKKNLKSIRFWALQGQSNLKLQTKTIHNTLWKLCSSKSLTYGFILIFLIAVKFDAPNSIKLKLTVWQPSKTKKKRKKQTLHNLQGKNKKTKKKSRSWKKVDLKQTNLSLQDLELNHLPPLAVQIQSRWRRRRRRRFGNGSTQCGARTERRCRR